MIRSRTKWQMIIILLTASIAFADEPKNGDPVTGLQPTRFTEKSVKMSGLEPGETFYPISVRFDDNYSHVAYAAKNAKGMFAVMDRQRSDTFDGIAKGTPIISSGQFHWAFIAYEASRKARAFIDGRAEPLFEGVDGFTFSPDGTRWAYRAAKEGKQTIVLDGKAGPLFDVIIKPSGPTFSPDGRRMAYGAINGRQGFLVIDGKSEPVDGIVQHIIFSPDSKRMAYIIKKDEEMMRVICDGKAGLSYKSATHMTFSPNSKRLAYIAYREDHWIAVLDGEELPEGDNIGMPLFSPDSRHIAYSICENDDECCVVLDGVKGKTYAKTGIYLFGADSNRLAYMAMIDENRSCIVVNETPGPAYNAVGMPVFSPNGAHLAYRARKKDKWFIVQDGRAHQKTFDGLRRPVFSPDSGHLAYVGIIGKQMEMIRDEVVMGRYDSVSFPHFSPNSQHLAYTGCIQDEWHVYIDGKAGQTMCNADLKDVPIVFESESKGHAVMMRLPGPEFWRIDFNLQ